jgi:hypothetical protein
MRKIKQKIIQLPGKPNFVKELKEQIRPFWLKNRVMRTIFYFLLRQYLYLQLLEGRESPFFERILFREIGVFKSVKESWLELLDRWRKRAEILEDLCVFEFLNFLKEFGLERKPWK